MPHGTPPQYVSEHLRPRVKILHAIPPALVAETATPDGRGRRALDFDVVIWWHAVGWGAWHVTARQSSTGTEHVSFPEVGSRPRLLDRVRQAIRTRHDSPRTEEAYVHWIRRYIVFHGKKHPSTLGAPEISTFLTWLAVERQVSASARNQALSAVLFLYWKMGTTVAPCRSCSAIETSD